MNQDFQPLDEATWTQLPALFEKLPEPVQLHLWGDPAASQREKEADQLCRLLARHFDTLHYQAFPRRVNYPYYPVLGVMGLDDTEVVDYGVRLIGLPAGYQMTSLVTAIQGVSFRGMTLEAVSRIKLHRLARPVRLEVLTSAENEGGPLMAQPAFAMAAANPHVRVLLIMTDQFPEAGLRYSVEALPHTVINGRVHVSGVVDESGLLKHMASAPDAS